jgi:hypothetical protein
MVLACVLGVGCAPCSSSEPPPRGVPPERSEAAPPPADPPPRPSRRALPGPKPFIDLSPSEDGPADDDEDEGERRDLSAELRASLTGLQTCLSGVTGRLPESTGVQVTVYVTGNGVVSRASVGASGWPDDARRCARIQAERVRFRAPVPDAPRSVAATVTVHAPPSQAREKPEKEKRWQPTSGVAIDDVPGREPSGPQGKWIDDVPGREPSGPQGKPIDDVPGREPTGPQGRPPSH